MNVLSLFDGISCGRVAFDRAGINVDNYYASEIDEYAIKISQHNYKDIIRLGDIKKWKEWDIDWENIDIVLGGFPCQAWSTAGCQLGDKNEKGMLFWDMLEIMKYVISKNSYAYFLIENVKMKKEFEEYITFHTEQALTNVNKILINSKLVSAQNRERYYWTNICDIEQPEDKNILLSDIVDGYVDRDKSMCIDANYGRGGNLRRYFFRGSRQVVFNDRDFMLSIDKKNKIHTIDNINIYGNNNKDKWRMLSVEECERLQTLPIGYTSCVSKVRAYHGIGNGWTVDVISHILQNIKV